MTDEEFYAAQAWFEQPTRPDPLEEFFAAAEDPLLLLQ